MMEVAFRAWLLAHAPLASLVGTRVDWGVRAQGKTLPAVTLERISSVPGMTYQGSDGWERSRIQIDAWGRTYLAAAQVAEVLAAPRGAGPAGLLVGFRGDLPGVAGGPGLRLRTFVVFRRSTGDDTDDEGPVHCAGMDILAWHRPI